MNKRDFIIITSIFAVTFLSRIFLVELYQSHWDGPQYSIAVTNYSLENQTPTPPGYPIYIGIAWFVNKLLGDPHYSLLFESVFFNAIGSVIIFLFGRTIKNWRVGIIASVLYITSPVIYFFGLTAYAYGINAVLSLSVSYVVYLLVFKKFRYPALLGGAYAVLIGFRPQEIIYTWPLILFSIYKLDFRQKLTVVVSFIASCLAWLIPLSFVVGGIQKYINIVWPIGNDKIPQFLLVNVFLVYQTLIKGLFLTLGVSLVIPFIYLANTIFRNKKINLSSGLTLFFGLWIIPPLIFNVFVRSDHAGYQLPYLISFFLINAILIETMWKKKQLLVVSVFVISTINLFIFFRDRDPDFESPYVPTSFHYSEIRKNDIQMKAKIDWIKSSTDPSNTAIILGEPDYFRPLMYHLPDYKITQIDKLVTLDEHYTNMYREAYNFQVVEKAKQDNTYLLPEHYKFLVCFDSECPGWYKGSANEVSLGFGATILEINLYEKFLKYGYKSLMFSNAN